MPSYSKNDVILVRYPFSALSGVKVRPAIIVNAPHASQDVFIVPLTSRTSCACQSASVSGHQQRIKLWSCVYWSVFWIHIHVSQHISVSRLPLER